MSCVPNSIKDMELAFPPDDRFYEYHEKQRRKSQELFLDRERRRSREQEGYLASFCGDDVLFGFDPQGRDQEDSLPGVSDFSESSDDENFGQDAQDTVGSVQECNLIGKGHEDVNEKEDLPASEDDVSPFGETDWSVLDGLDVSIPTWESVDVQGKKVPFYEIKLVNKHGLKWVVAKRYSDFNRLHQQLSFCTQVAHMNTQRHGNYLLRGGNSKTNHPEPPPLPPTRWFGWTNSSFESIERRRLDLQDYLRKLLYSSHGYFGHTLLNDFLDVPAVRVAQRLLAGPRHLPNPIKSNPQRLPSHSLPIPKAGALVQGAHGSPSITLTPPMCFPTSLDTHSV
mmetsp:Transcript_141043/g.245847  ORF Transcript_141043/g.245847 Transcript_141043/m.245847 type:complete len:339 (-) Transcript_141043:1298-2314(-)